MDVIYRYDPFAPIVARQIPDADAAIRELVQGNDRFKSIVDRMQDRTLGESAGEPMIIPMSPMTWGLPLFPGAMPIADAIAKLQQEVAERRIRQVNEKKFQQFDEGGEAANEY